MLVAVEGVDRSYYGILSLWGSTLRNEKSSDIDLFIRPHPLCTGPLRPDFDLLFLYSLLSAGALVRHVFGGGHLPGVAVDS